MNVWDSLRHLFGAKDSPPRAMRNRPDGMAWIRGCNEGDGDEALNGRAVRTVYADSHGFWLIDPPQLFTVTQNTIYIDIGVVIFAGQVLSVTAIHDECLEPWHDDEVTDDEVRELYARDAKERARPEIIALPVREM